MEKLIFFGLVIPIFLFVLYLGGTAIMTGFSAIALKPVIIAVPPKYKTKRKIGITKPKKINFSII